MGKQPHAHMGYQVIGILSVRHMQVNQAFRCSATCGRWCIFVMLSGSLHIHCILYYIVIGSLKEQVKNTCDINWFLHCDWFSQEYVKSICDISSIGTNDFEILLMNYLLQSSSNDYEILSINYLHITIGSLQSS